MCWPVRIPTLSFRIRREASIMGGRPICGRRVAVRLLPSGKGRKDQANDRLAEYS